jgi:hypothetical protein
MNGKYSPMYMHAQKIIFDGAHFDLPYCH